MTPAVSDVAAATRDALDAAKGDRDAAARALSIHRSALFRRLANLPGVRLKGRKVETLRQWVDRTWPMRGGHRAVKVVPPVTYEGTGEARRRVYVLAAHGDAAEGEHVNRVPAVGEERTRVVCQRCKEGRAT